MFACFLVGAGWGADLERFTISQVIPQLPVVTSYLDVVDSNGQPLTNLVPTSFSATLGVTPLQVAEVRPFESTGEGVAYAFLVDTSRSINARQFDEMRGAIRKWLAGLAPSDRAAICTFGEDYHLLVDFTSDKPALLASLANLALKDAHTRLYLAIERAIELAHRTDPDLPARRAVVVLSHGKDEGSALTPEDVVRQIRSSHLPIYAIGYSNLRRAERQQYLDVLHRFSNLSGGVYREAAAESLSELYASMTEAIRRVFRVKLTCQVCPSDGRSYPLRMAVSVAGKGLEDTLDVVPQKSPAAPEPVKPNSSWWHRIPWWAYALIALGLIGAAVARLRRREIPVVPMELPNPVDTTDVPEAPPGKGLPLKLVLIAGKEIGRTHKLQLRDRVVIGRSADCDVVVADDPKVSSRHCELILSEGRVLVYDLGSTNKTSVNGVPVLGRHRLEDQDCILVGETEFRLRMGGE